MKAENFGVTQVVLFEKSGKNQILVTDGNK